MLTEKWNAAVVITCGPMDEESIEEVVSGLHCKYQVVKNQPIRTVGSLLSEVDLLISNDTGIMHVGAAVGAPVLSLFGPTDCLQWAPLGEGNQYLSARTGDITEIEVQDVLKTADEMLGKRKLLR
jgi:ADP-heptose:LPS heptosyltransferase